MSHNVHSQHSFSIQAFCDSNPGRLYESHPSSAVHVAARRGPLSSTSVAALPLRHDTSEPGGATASTTLLSVEKGPCEFCRQVIPLTQLVRHEVYRTHRKLDLQLFVLTNLFIDLYHAGNMQIQWTKAQLGPTHFLPAQPCPSPFLTHVTSREHYNNY